MKFKIIEGIGEQPNLQEMTSILQYRFGKRSENDYGLDLEIFPGKMLVGDKNVFGLYITPKSIEKIPEFQHVLNVNNYGLAKPIRETFIYPKSKLLEEYSPKTIQDELIKRGLDYSFDGENWTINGEIIPDEKIDKFMDMLIYMNFNKMEIELTDEEEEKMKEDERLDKLIRRREKAREEGEDWFEEDV